MQLLCTPGFITWVFVCGLASGFAVAIGLVWFIFLRK